jgi:putative two-component system response regulator
MMETTMKLSNLLLIIRNGPANARDWSEPLVTSGWEIVTIDFGRDAVASARQIQPRLIILEVAKSDAAFLSVLRKLKDTPDTRNIPVLIISGLSEMECIQLLDAGAAAFCALGALNSAVLTATIARVLRNQQQSLPSAHPILPNSSSTHPPQPPGADSGR